MEYELTSYDSAVHRCNHYTTKTLLCLFHVVMSQNSIKIAIANDLLMPNDILPMYVYQKKKKTAETTIQKMNIWTYKEDDSLNAIKEHLSVWQAVRINQSYL